MTKLFVIKSILIVLSVVAIDQFLGVSLEYAAYHARGGEKKWEHYAIYDSRPDIAIFGSSRALLHYDTRVLQDSLGGEAINFGSNGHGVIYGYGILTAISERHWPRVIILDVFHVYDLEKNDNTKYVASLRRFTDIPAIANVVYEFDPMEQYKQYCRTYKWNSEWYYYVRDAVKIRPLDYLYNGFFPQSEKKEMSEDVVDVNGESFDEFKISYLKRFIHEASQNSRLFVFVSPFYKGGESKYYDAVENICEEEHVPYYDFWGVDSLNTRSDLFIDRCHLNYVGAREYSQIVAHIIKESFHNND